MSKKKFPRGRRAPSKRPFRTYYYNVDGVTAAQGHSASEQGAIRGCVWRIVSAQYVRAEIFDDGVLAYTVRPHNNGLRISYGSGGTAT